MFLVHDMISFENVIWTFRCYLNNEREKSHGYLIIHVFDDQQHRAVHICNVPVQSLQTAAMFFSAVDQSPRVSLHASRQATSQLETKTDQILNPCFITSGCFLTAGNLLPPHLLDVRVLQQLAAVHEHGQRIRRQVPVAAAKALSALCLINGNNLCSHWEVIPSP